MSAGAVLRSIQNCTLDQITKKAVANCDRFCRSESVLYTRGGVELPPEVLLDGGVFEGVVLVGILLDGMSLGGRVLGVVPVFGEHGPATVEVVPAVPVVPLAAGVVLPMVPAGVPLVVELEVVLPVVLEVPFVPHGPTVVAVVPLGTVD
jgi:hypothetical protein